MLDFQTQTVTGYVNSQLLGSGTFANPTTVLSRVNLGLNGAPNGDAGCFDQLSITSTPEPGYAGLVAAGLALIAVRARAGKHRMPECGDSRTTTRGSAGMTEAESAYPKTPKQAGQELQTDEQEATDPAST